MTETLEQEIRTLRSLFWSERDPDGRGFAPLADAYRRAGDSKQALEILDDGIGRHPEFVPGHVVAARLYMDLAFFAEAELAARKALDLDAENVEALRVLVGSLEGKGSSHEAREFRNRLATLEPLPEGVEVAGETSRAAALDFGPDEPEGDPGDEPVEALVFDTAEDDVVAEETVAAEEGDEAMEEFVFETAEERVEDDSDAEEEEEILSASAFGEADHGEREIKEYLEPTEGMGELDVDLGDLALGEVTAEQAPPVEDPVFDPGMMVPAGEDEPEAADEAAMDLEALAPDEPAMDLAALAPDEPEAADEGDGPTMDLAALAPDEPEAADEVGEPTMDLAALAPDEPEAVDDADEAAMDLAALAPDEPETADEVGEPTMELAALAPDEPEAADDADEPTMELAALAPDEPEAADDADEPTMELAALAPDEPETADDADEPTMELAALAPDEPETADDADEPTMELAALAPDEPEAADDADEPTMDLAALAPDEPEAADEVGEPTMDLAALAPDEPETADDADEPTMELAALAPDEPEAADEGDEAAEPIPEYLSEEAADAPLEESDEAPIYTRTIAALYVKQGALERALGVYRALAEAEPEAEDLAREIASLEEQIAAAPDAGAAVEEGEMVDEELAGHAGDEEEAEVLARELSESGVDTHEVDTPFAWTDEEAAEPPSAGPPVSNYFARMLSWTPDDDEEQA